ncbi:MAG: FMN-binding protein [Mycobacterium sp.]|nr:FMN-binding protein [Mycobacterium sp.]
MKRYPLVLGATAAGLTGVLTFHTHGSSGVAAGTTIGPIAAPAPTDSPSTAAPAPAPSATTPSGTSSASRTVQGTSVQTRFGPVQVTVTAQGGKLTALSATAPGDDRRSEEINYRAVPLLNAQAKAAQSANIDGVSGATYTSEGYAQSLQSALDKLGLGG